MKKQLKLALSTLSFQKWTIEELSDLLCKNGIFGLELRLGLSEWSMPDMTDMKCQILKQLLSEKNIIITNLGTSVCVKGYEKAALKRLESDMKFACIMGVKALRIMFGNHRRTWSEEGLPCDYEGICAWIKEADKLAEKYGRELWIETHYEFATGKMLNKLFLDCSLKNCRIIWDIMHPLEQKESIQVTYDFIKDYLVHVHVKDGIPWSDADMANWKYTKIGEGIIPIKDIVNLIGSGGYEGYYSLEWEPMWHEEIRGYEDDLIISEFSKYMTNLFKNIE